MPATRLERQADHTMFAYYFLERATIMPVGRSVATSVQCQHAGGKRSPIYSHNSQEALQRSSAARAPDNPSVEADGQHTRPFRSFLQEEVDAVAQVLKKFYAARPAWPRKNFASLASS